MRGYKHGSKDVGERLVVLGCVVTADLGQGLQRRCIDKNLGTGGWFIKEVNPKQTGEVWGSRMGKEEADKVPQGAAPA